MRLRQAWLALATVTCVACSGSGVRIVRGTPPLDRERVAHVGADAFIAGVFHDADGTILPYRLLPPLQVVPGERYPLVVHFHNSAAIGDDNRLQIERDVSARAWALHEVRARHPAFVLAPQFPQRSADYDDPQSPRVAIAAPVLETALALVDAIAAEHPVDPRRIHATGFSMGASTAWLAAVAQPERFAGIVAMGGVAPDRARAATLVELPILVMHGDADAENPIRSDLEMVAAIRAAGGRRVRLRQYASLGHQPPGDLIPGDAWRDWLFEQHRDR